MTAVRVSGVGLVLLLASGCLYHNVIYNADRIYRQGEVDRRAGRAQAADSAYRDVVRKTGEAWRGQPDAEWAPAALLLMARARIRLGDYAEAEAALDRLEAGPLDPAMAGAAAVERALVQEHTGDPAAALEVVNAAMGGALDDEARVEAHLLRGRLLLARGQAEAGWWDLERAVELDPAVRGEAGIQRLRWGLEQGDGARSRRALDLLLADARADVRADSVLALLEGASDRLGPAAAADLLAGVDTARWNRGPRGRLALARAGWLDAAGDTAGAVAEAEAVAAGLGLSAAQARLLLSGWRAGRARDLAELAALRRLLLPVADDPEVATRLAGLEEMEELVGIGLDQPLGLFAAGEVARDRLGARYVARGLFLAYADQAPSDPWAPKALLAALEASPAEGDRAWIRGRLEPYGDSPYVLAALGGPAAGFAALEEELDVRLRGLVGR